MANIRVDVSYNIIDGSEVVFNAPCDFSEVEGLRVYYLDHKTFETKSMDFKFCDALGNDLTELETLFNKDVLIKAILDVTNGKAFIQNEVTNKYLEDKFKSIPITTIEKTSYSGVEYVPEEPSTDGKYHTRMGELWIDKEIPKAVIIQSEHNANNSKMQFAVMLDIRDYGDGTSVGTAGNNMMIKRNNVTSSDISSAIVKCRIGEESGGWRKLYFGSYSTHSTKEAAQNAIINNFNQSGVTYTVLLIY